MIPCFENCAVCLCLFSERIVAETDKNYVYNENPKQIRRSELTTFEVLFMQNAKQIIAKKVTKTASKLMF